MASPNLLLDRALAYQANLHREASAENKARAAAKANREINVLLRAKKPARA
ncbi:MAG TPA: hypothetical protein VNT60_02130 [Deinococcales bacterium]|nr:hypothetical protein [Deinococcales bacterium]